MGTRILVIDDDMDTAGALLQELRDRGYRILAAEKADGSETVLRVGPLSLDLIDRTAWRDGRRIELRPWEFRILEYFMRNPARIVRRERLLCEVWRCNPAVQSNRVDVHLSKLRRKLDSGDVRPMLHNVRGIGFILEPPE